jgi:hypothetical protein
MDFCEHSFGPHFERGLIGPNGRLMRFHGGGSKSSSTANTSTTSNTTATDSSLNAAAGATVVGSGGTLVQTTLDADVARASLRTAEETTLAALEAGAKVTDTSLTFAEELGRESIGTVREISQDAMESANRAAELAARSAERATAEALDFGRAGIGAVVEVSQDAIDASNRAAGLVAAGSANALAEGFDFGRAVLDASGKTVDRSMTLAEEALFSQRQTSKDALSIVGDVSRDSLEAVTRFGESTVTANLDVVQQALESAHRAQIESYNLSRSLGETAAGTARHAIEQLEKNKRDPDSDVIQTSTKYLAIAGGILGAALILKSR